MGGELMNAIMQATSWHDDGYRRVRGTEELVHIKEYSAMESDSLIALTGCRAQSDVRIEDEKGLGWDGSNEQQIVYLKRDTDGLLKIFQVESLEVENCDPRPGGRALVADAAKIYGTVLGLLEKHVAAGGLNQADYSTSGFGPYLGHEARNRILFELECARVSSLKLTVTGASKRLFTEESG